MSAEGIMENMAERNGWSVEEQLDYALEYINNQGDDAAFQDFLEGAALDQEWIGGKVVCSWCHETITSGDEIEIVAGFNMHTDCAAKARARDEED